MVQRVIWAPALSPREHYQHGNRMCRCLRWPLVLTHTTQLILVKLPASHTLVCGELRWYGFFPMASTLAWCWEAIFSCHEYGARGRTDFYQIFSPNTCISRHLRLHPSAYPSIVISLPSQSSSSKCQPTWFYLLVNHQSHSPILPSSRADSISQSSLSFFIEAATTASSIISFKLNIIYVELYFIHWSSIISLQCITSLNFILYLASSV